MLWFLLHVVFGLCYCFYMLCSNKYGATCAVANSSYTKIHMQKYSRASDNKIPTKIKELKPIMRFRNVLFSNIPNTGTGNVCTCIRVYACMCSFLQHNTVQYNAIEMFRSLVQHTFSTQMQSKTFWRCFFLFLRIACDSYRTQRHETFTHVHVHIFIYIGFIPRF